MPQLKIVQPSENQTILGTQVTVSFIVGDLEIGREGHLHLWLDENPEQASYSARLETHYDYTLSGLPPGPHSLSLEVVKPNHEAFMPRLLQTVNFQTKLAPTTSIPFTAQAATPPNFLFDKTFIGLALGTIIILAGIFIGRAIKGRLD